MAKADLKNLEREELGRVIERTFELAGLSQKEAAALLERDQAQIARWIAGTERPQLESIYATPTLRARLLLAMAEQAGVAVRMVIEFPLERTA
jgi:hypothetical protein